MDYNSSESEPEYSEHDLNADIDNEATEIKEDGQKIRRRPKHAGFMEAMGKLLTRPVKEQEETKAQDPILAKSKSIEQKLDDQSVLDKARRMYNHEQKKRMRQDHISIAAYHPDREKRLKNIATRGVVQLFNAFQQQQKAKQQLKLGGKRVRKDVELATTKSAFLQYLNKDKEQKQDKKQDDLKKKQDNVKNTGASWIRKDFNADPSLKDWDTVMSDIEGHEDEQLLLVTE